MKSWEQRALDILERSISNIPIEYNEIDWKSSLSENSLKLSKHLSAFSNLNGGGFLVFGINNNGTFTEPLNKSTIDEIVTKIGNISANNLSESLGIDHVVSNFKGQNLLIFFIPESPHKPISLRGNNIYDCYKRSAGNTIKMSATEVRGLIAFTQHITFEEQVAEPDLTGSGVLTMLDYRTYFELLNLPHPTNPESILSSFVDEELIKIGNDGKYNLTNLGAILFASNLKQIKVVSRKSIRVVIYSGTSKIQAIKEQEGKKGYAVGWEGLVKYIMDQLPANEVIEHALRKEVKMYPEIAIREFVANAMIHQDFNVSGAGTMIEIFKDRIEITNPGIPLIDTNRFIGTAPRSRNETLASLMRRLRICEERGSGVIRAIAAIEAFQLPAPKFIKEEDYTKVIIYAHKTLSKMDKDDRIRACYQHTCLQHVSNKITNNESVRQRFSISKENYPMASRIISDTIESGLIKPSDPENKSKKHSTYLPYWA